MEDKKNISIIVEHLKAGYHESEIKDLLEDKNISKDNLQLLFDKSKEIVFEDNLILLAKKNKFRFITYISLLILTLIIFIFYLPIQIELPSTIYPIIGSVLICIFSFISFAYVNTWNPEYVKKYETPNINYIFLIIPCGILYFIIALRFEVVADNILKENQVDVIGKVISGGQTEIQNRRGNITTSTIVVEFLTKEDKKIIAYEDISSYEFNQFYMNKEVKLIYSKSNPENINLLISSSDLRKFKNSKEKDIVAKDLIHLMSIDNKNIEAELNKISYGWEYNNQELLWINNRKNVGVSVTQNLVLYIDQNFYTSDSFLEESSFKRVDKTNSDNLSEYNDNKVYENDNYKATVKMLRRGNGQEPLAITTITKK
jgi:hypothetical protein